MLIRNAIIDVYGNNFPQAVFIIDEIEARLRSVNETVLVLKSDINVTQTEKEEQSHEFSDDSAIVIKSVRYWGDENRKNQRFMHLDLMQKVDDEYVTEFEIEFDDQVQQQFESVQGTIKQRINHVAKWYLINRVLPKLRG